MCGICGCSENNEPDHLEKKRALHHHENAHLISVEQDLLAKNNQFAANNRDFFVKKNILALNMMSSPGAGKTTLLSQTITDLKHQMEMAVIVGDLQTEHDAMRLKASGVKAMQINTGRVCHLDAHMVGHALEKCSLNEGAILFIENVGNLVCPALFDLGEKHKIVILSVTEGDNKPLKYPEMFRGADLLIITKTDLLPYVEFDSQQCEAYVRRINPDIKVLSLSSTTGVGLKSWYQWLGLYTLSIDKARSCRSKDCKF